MHVLMQRGFYKCIYDIVLVNYVAQYSSTLIYQYKLSKSTNVMNVSSPGAGVFCKAGTPSMTHLGYPNSGGSDC